jgi:Sugar kinases, ribokinase family
VAVGELVIDWIAQEKGAGFIESSHFIKSLGGNASNVAIALSRLGTQSRIIAKVGADVHGKYLLKVLSNEGVDVSFVKIEPKYSTANCYVFTTLDDDNTFLNWPPGNAASMLTVDDLNDEQLEGASCIHATGISLTTEPRKTAVISLLERAVKKGLIVSFDAGFPTGEGSEARLAVEEAIDLAHIVKVNLVELFYWARQYGVKGCDDPLLASLGSVYEHPPSSGFEGNSTKGFSISRERVETLARNLFDRIEPEILIVTLAERGSMVMTRRYTSWRRSIVVDSIAGVGAGDAYIAGFLHSLCQLDSQCTPESIGELSQDTLDEANKFASVVGALATTHISAYEGLPSLAKVREVIGVN